MKVRQSEQVSQYIGQKVTVFIQGKAVTRVLREDADGLYIRLNHQRVAVSPVVDHPSISFTELGSGPAAMSKSVESSHPKTTTSELDGQRVLVPMQVLWMKRMQRAYRKARLLQLRRSSSIVMQRNRQRKHLRAHEQGLPP